MRTFELEKREFGKKGTPVFYHLYVRHYDGIEVTYTPVEKLTVEEAWALAECKYCSLGSKEVPGPTNIDAADLIKIKPVNIMAQWPDSKPVISDRLVLVLSENTELNREAVELVDPWYNDNPGCLEGHNFIQRFWVSEAEREKEIEKIKSTYPIPKPDPEPIRAIKFALKQGETSGYYFLQEWMTGSHLDEWPEFETYQALKPGLNTRII